MDPESPVLPSYAVRNDGRTVSEAGSTKVALSSFAARRQEVRLVSGVNHFPAGRVAVFEVHAAGESLDQLRRREPVSALEVDGHRKAY
jgi:hypothetical protein